jgi:thiamine-monophosphate kinase
MAGDAGEGCGLGEHEALARLRRLLPVAPEGEVWFGDDAAVLKPVAGAPLMLLATDTVIAGLDADLSFTTLSDLGWKAMAVNLSDIAAMGGTPSHAVVSVVGLGPEDLGRLYEGVLAAADEYRCPVVGGDLSAGQQPVVTVAMVGSVDGPPVLRRGARAGDTIWVTGPLGASAAGLRVLKGRGPQGAERARPVQARPVQAGSAQAGPAEAWPVQAWPAQAGPAEEEALVRAHARPRPALAAGTVARRAGATAMIDVSDGLVADLAQLASQSGVGFELAEVPAAPGATSQEALAGGDDYVLVFTIPPAGAELARQAFAAAGLPAPLMIGECVPDPSRHFLAGATVQVRGWEHAL